MYNLGWVTYGLAIIIWAVGTLSKPFFIRLSSISSEDDKVKKYPIEYSVVWEKEFFDQNSVITKRANVI